MAHTLIPVLIVLSLSVISSWYYHARNKRYWLATLAAAGTAGTIWVFGTLIFLQDTAPPEGWQGRSDLFYALRAFVVTSLVAFMPAMLVGWGFKKTRCRATAGDARQPTL